MDTVDDQGRYRIQCSNGDTETRNMDDEKWRISTSLLNASSASASKLELTSTEPDAIKFVFENFGDKEFLGYQAQGFPEFSLFNAEK